VGERRQLFGPEPPDRVMFVGGDVLRRSLPLTDKPGAEEYRLFATCVQPTQMGQRARHYLYAKFLVHLPRERAQF
jgi:hypothetical protein